MTTPVRKLCLVLALLAIVMLPLAGSVLKFGGLPPGYGDFPSQKVKDDPGFNPYVFWAGVAVEGAGVLFLAFPGWFGFKKPPKVPRAKGPRVPLPLWFWVGLGLVAVGVRVAWAKEPFLDPIDKYMFVPIWWGMILALDGWVYRRRNRKSLLSTRPKTVFLLAVVSSAGWFAFEYLDFFVLENWYYPYGTIFSAYGNIVWFLCSYTIIFPQLFEVYQLFETFPGLAGRYSLGPKIRVGNPVLWTVLGAGAVLSFLMGLLPYPLFFTIWINPVLILGAALGLFGIWTVFTPIRDGNWGPLLLTGMAMVLCGLAWELVNFGSEYFFGFEPMNPSFWRYSIPYVNSVHLPFSEMPILGYFGYIPYAWVCWLQWGTAADLVEFDPNLGLPE